MVLNTIASTSMSLNQELDKKFRNRHFCCGDWEISQISSVLTIHMFVSKQVSLSTTYKLFVIPSEAHWVQVRFDFYEIGKYHYFSDSIHCAFKLHLKLLLFHFDSDSWGEFSRFSKYILLVGFCISCSGLISCESL